MFTPQSVIYCLGSNGIDCTEFVDSDGGSLASDSSAEGESSEVNVQAGTSSNGQYTQEPRQAHNSKQLIITVNDGVTSNSIVVDESDFERNQHDWSKCNRFTIDHSKGIIIVTLAFFPSETLRDSGSHYRYC